MMQVWLLDEHNYFTGESVFVEEVADNMTTEPLLVGYVKAKWTGEEWVEGATQEEIQEWQEQNKPQPELPTDVEVLQQQMTQLIINQL